MNNQWKRTAVVTLTMLAATFAGHESSAAADVPAPQAQLYELTENMKLTKGRVPRRIAVSQLMGFAEAGTPLCPKSLVEAVNPGATTCAINATGADSIVTTTGLGSFNGTFTVVVQGDNPVDGPEAVVDRGRFRGRMDFSPALVSQIPFGHVDGVMLGGRGTKLPFTGVFRLPFLGSAEVTIPGPGGTLVTATLRHVFCPLTLTPNPNLGGPDIAYIDTMRHPVTGDWVPSGSCIDVLPTELSLGVPTVRFDIWFDNSF